MKNLIKKSKATEKKESSIAYTYTAFDDCFNRELFLWNLTVFLGSKVVDVVAYVKLSKTSVLQCTTCLQTIEVTQTVGTTIRIQDVPFSLLSEKFNQKFKRKL